MFASRRAGSGVIKTEWTQLSNGSTLEAERKSTSPGVVELQGCPRRRMLAWVRREAQMTEDSADGPRSTVAGPKSTTSPRHFAFGASTP